MRWRSHRWYKPKAFVRIAALMVSARHTHTYDDVVRVHLRNETFLADPVDRDSVPRSQHGVSLNLRRKNKIGDRMSAAELDRRVLQSLTQASERRYREIHGYILVPFLEAYTPMASRIVAMRDSHISTDAVDAASHIAQGGRRVAPAATARAISCAPIPPST